MKSVRFLVLAAGLALCLTLPFAVRGYRGDDFQFHFSSWMGLRQAWFQGEFAPGWDGLANYTFGDPRFCFYPPISLWLGALLCTILPPALAPAAFVWIGLMLAGMCMLAASEALIGDRYKYLAALLYMASPYVLITAITRFAVAELLVLAWLPLIVLYFIRAMGRANKRPTALLGSLLALTWLANIPASIVLGYVLLFAAAIASIRRRTVWPFLRFLIAEGIAILASSFYLAPAFVERKWITTEALLHQDFRDYFIFGSLSHLQRIHFELGLWVISCVEIAAIAGCFFARERNATQHSRLLFVMSAIAFLFQLPLTTILWLRLPELRFVQFPFRFLAIMGVALPLVALGSGIKPWAMKLACGIMVALAMLPVFFYLRIAPTTASSVNNFLATFERGYPGTDEYVPAGSKPPNTPLALPPVGSIDDPFGAACEVASLPDAPRLKRISVSAASTCRVRFPMYFYPYWEASDETGKILATTRDEQGLLVVEVPKGRHTVQVRFHVFSLIRMISMTASLAVFLYFLVELVRRSREPELRTREDSVTAHERENVRPEITATEATP